MYLVAVLRPEACSAVLSLLESAVGITGLRVLTKQAEELPISKN